MSTEQKLYHLAGRFGNLVLTSSGDGSETAASCLRTPGVQQWVQHERSGSREVCGYFLTK